jgi:hypothetical protein
MKVTALKKIGAHRVGETFEVTAKQASVLILAKLAMPADDLTDPPRLRRTYRRRDLQAESTESS